jgi:hypothetical protein
LNGFWLVLTAASPVVLQRITRSPGPKGVVAPVDGPIVTAVLLVTRVIGAYVLTIVPAAVTLRAPLRPAPRPKVSTSSAWELVPIDSPGWADEQATARATGRKRHARRVPERARMDREAYVISPLHGESGARSQNEAAWLD